MKCGGLLPEKVIFRLLELAFLNNANLIKNYVNMIVVIAIIIARIA
jgi:hypothetical protein